MRHLKLFETVNQYQNFKSSDRFKLPNISYCLDDESLAYNPWKENTVKRIAYFNVTETGNLPQIDKLLLPSLGGIKSLKLNGEYLDYQYEYEEKHTFTYNEILNKMTFEGDIFSQTYDSKGNQVYIMNMPTDVPLEILAYPNNEYVFDDDFDIKDYAVALVIWNNYVVQGIYCEPLEYYNDNAFNVNGNTITFADGLKSVLYDNPKAGWFSEFGLDNMGYGIFFYNMYDPTLTNYTCHANVIISPPFYENITLTSNNIFNDFTFDGEAFTTSNDVDENGNEVTVYIMNTPTNYPSSATCTKDTIFKFNSNINLNHLYATIGLEIENLYDTGSLMDLINDSVFIYDENNNTLKLSSEFSSIYDTLYVYIYDITNPTNNVYVVESPIETTPQCIYAPNYGANELEIEFSSDIIPYFLFCISENTMKYMGRINPSLNDLSDDFFVGMKTVPLLPPTLNLDRTRFIEENAVHEYMAGDGTVSQSTRLVPTDGDGSTTFNIISYVFPYRTTNDIYYHHTINLIDNSKVDNIIFYNKHTSTSDINFSYPNLTSIVFPNTITGVYLRHLRYHSNLTSITLSDSTTWFDPYSSDGLDSLTTIISKAVTAPKCNYESYSTVTFKSAGTVYYPKGSDYSSWIKVFPENWTFEEVEF